MSIIFIIFCFFLLLFFFRSFHGIYIWIFGTLDGGKIVRSNKNSPKDRRKCSTEFHNQPKMAIVSKQQKMLLLQQTNQKLEDEVKSNKNGKKSTVEDAILSSLRMGRRRRTKSKKEETESNHANNNDDNGEVGEEDKQHQPQHQQNKRVHYNTAAVPNNNTIVNVKVKSEGGNNSSYINRKSSKDYSDGVTMTTTMSVQVPWPVPLRHTEGTAMAHQQRCTGIVECYCRACYKPDKVAIVNNVPAAAATTATSTTNKYILRFQAPQQQQLEDSSLDHSSFHLPSPPSHQQKENYQCPTGKLCCLQLTRNVRPSVAKDAAATATGQQQRETMTNDNVSSRQQTNYETCGSSSTGVVATHKPLRNEWQILTHLTQDHQLAVNQYYAEFGQRIAIRHDLLQNSVICLNLRGNDPEKQIEKFFIAFIPMANTAEQNLSPTSTINTNVSNKVAVFIWHLNPLENNNGHPPSSCPLAAASDVDEEVSNFDAIIENPQTGIKWFGRAHCLSTPWSQIYHKQHFLMHEVTAAGPATNPRHPTAGAVEPGNDDAFVIVIKSKS